ncbi:MAG: HTH domain-containing protein [Firmicutes bacterium]|nr:HTH domain-containing protein [Bacillota bacterium]MCR4711067.1 HTH domain-containing protein [Clostridia bacterium]
MSTKLELLKLLDSNCGHFVSGQMLAEELGISRAAVNKAATALKKSGYNILSRPSQGYLLRGNVDLLTALTVESVITKPCQLLVPEKADSALDIAIATPLREDEPCAVVCDGQKNGIGKRGKPFFSPAGAGIYLSFAFRPKFNFNESTFFIMNIAMTVVKAIEEVCEINARICWPNDLYFQGKKVGELFTYAESNLETGRLDRLIVNVNLYCFPVKGAGTLPKSCGYLSEDADAFSRSVLAGRIIQNLITMLEKFPNTDFLPDYRRKCFILGKPITVHSLSGGRDVAARAIDVDDNGGLAVEYMEGARSREMEVLKFGEISPRDTL